MPPHRSSDVAASCFLLIPIDAMLSGLIDDGKAKGLIPSSTAFGSRRVIQIDPLPFIAESNQNLFRTNLFHPAIHKFTACNLNRSTQPNRATGILNHNYFKSSRARIHSRMPHTIVISQPGKKDARYTPFVQMASQPGL